MDFLSQITQLGVPVVTTVRSVAVSAPLTGGGDLSANRTISLSVDSSLQVVSSKLGVSALVASSAALTAHAARTDNPHDVTAAQAGAQPLGNELTALQALADTAGFLKKTGNAGYSIDTSAYSVTSHTHSYQPLDPTLTQLAALPTTNGLIRQMGANTFLIDTSDYAITAHNHSGVYVTPNYYGNVVIDGNFIVRDSPANTRFDVNLDATNVVRLFARNYAISAFQALGIYASFVSINDAHYFGTGATIAQSLGVGVTTSTGIRILTNHQADTSVYHGLVINNAAMTANRLVVRGDNYFGTSAAWSLISDRRRKQDIVPEEAPLARLLRTPAVQYRLIEDVERDGAAARVRHGVIAQEVQPIWPEIVTESEQPNGERLLSVDYTDLIGPLVGAVQELARRITVLEEHA